MVTARQGEQESFSGLTQQFLSQGGELLDGQASLGGGGELPAQHLGHLVPRTHRGLGEEVHILQDQETNVHAHLTSGSWVTEGGRGGCSSTRGSCANLGVVGEHIVPQDGCPGIGHLADVGDDHHR